MYIKKYLLLLLFSVQASAVVINPKGLGEFLLVPYYTVNNELNTLVTVTNTTQRDKAIKINFREGLNGHAVLTYNVYLEANDVWAFALTATTSTVGDNTGQPSALHVTSDASCAPFLNKSGQEFLPFELLDGPENMQRVREGYIEIIEMAELSNGLAEELEFAPNTTLSDNCSIIEQSWNDGFWPNEIGQIATQEMNPVSGGLMAEATLIDVAEGINYSIPVTALADFFPDETIAHSSPGDTGLSFDAAKSEATLITADGAMNLGFDNGTDAASAVFTALELTAPFELLSILGAESEIIYVQPTRRFYLNEDNVTATAPYNGTNTANNCSAETYGGTVVSLNIFDRNANQEPSEDVTIPTPAEESICGAVFVHSMSNDPNTVQTSSILTGSQNFKQINVDTAGLLSESGTLETYLLGADTMTATTDDDESIQIWGLPMLGVSLQKFTNANASPGLLAQYGSAHTVKSSFRFIEE